MCAPSSAFCCKGKYFTDAYGNEKESWSKNFIREKYAPFLMKTPVKIMVIIFELILISFMAYGTFLLENKFDFEWLLNADDPV